MELYIIRHAESENNAGPEDERTEDPSLSPLGYQQAECLVNRIRHLRPTRILVSPFLRTLETIEPYIRKTGQVTEAWIDIHEQGGVMAGVGEDNYEGRPGMKRSEIELKIPGIQIGNRIDEEGWWKSRPWEDYQSTQTRAERVCEELYKDFAHSSERVLLITHGMFMRFLVGAFLKLSGLGKDHIHLFANTSVTQFFITPTTTHLGLMNCTRHLPETWITGTDRRPYCSGENVIEDD